MQEMTLENSDPNFMAHQKISKHLSTFDEEKKKVNFAEKELFFLSVGDLESGKPRVEPKCYQVFEVDVTSKMPNCSSSSRNVKYQ